MGLQMINHALTNGVSVIVASEGTLVVQGVAIAVAGTAVVAYGTTKVVAAGNNLSSDLDSLIRINTQTSKFESLSKASEYGIRPYNELRKMISGTGLHAHHIIEQRLVKHLGIDPSEMLSVTLTKDEHQIFTNAWRTYYPYGMDYSILTKEDLWQTAQKIYQDYPELLDASKTILFG